MSLARTVRIGGASGFWGDSSVGAPQLLQLGKVDYLVFDYLAELTMSILSSARLRNPQMGYATDFVDITIKDNLKDILAQGVKVVSNAGGVNVKACAAAVQSIARTQGLDPKIAIIEGDDVMPILDIVRSNGIHAFSGKTEVPATFTSANAYFGALPIRAALDEGADIVITGRCVDSAVTLGILMHEFGWSNEQYDLLAQGTLAGHLLECGCQATGGIHTDWEKVPWSNIGYPIAECGADGEFSLTKPPTTGGLVSPFTVGEQLLYEIGDPRRYIMPDVVCDFSAVTITQSGPDTVRVSGAKGLPPTPDYKVSATYVDGFRCIAQLSIVGFQAARKARRTGEAILEKMSDLFRLKKLADFIETNIEVLGSETGYGPHASAADVREVILRLSVRHHQKEALDLFVREISASGTSYAPGTTGSGGSGRAKPSPNIKQFSFLLDKRKLSPVLSIGDKTRPIAIPLGFLSNEIEDAPALSQPVAALDDPSHDVELPLIKIAYGRSGDKGDISNIGLIARTSDLLPILRREVTEQRVSSYLSHLVTGTVTRYDLPGLNAVNFVCEDALGGGGMASLRNDPLGKSMAQILLSMPIRVPARLVPTD